MFVFAYNCSLGRGDRYAHAYSRRDAGPGTGLPEALQVCCQNRAGQGKPVTPATPPSANSLRYFALGVLCVAMLLGGYFMQLNAKEDRQREQAAERLALCRQVERVASVATSAGLELRDTCQQLEESGSKSVTPP